MVLFHGKDRTLAPKYRFDLSETPADTPRDNGRTISGSNDGLLSSLFSFFERALCNDPWSLKNATKKQTINNPEKATRSTLVGVRWLNGRSSGMGWLELEIGNNGFGSAMKKTKQKLKQQGVKEGRDSEIGVSKMLQPLSIYTKNILRTGESGGEVI